MKIYENYYSIAEIASLLKITKRTVYSLISNGKIEACKLAGNQKKLYVSKGELERYRNSSKQTLITSKHKIFDKKDNMQFYDTIKERLLQDREFLDQLAASLDLQPAESSESKKEADAILEAMKQDPDAQQSFDNFRKTKRCYGIGVKNIIDIC